MITKNCLLCEKKFEAKNCLVKKGWGIFCSRKCSLIWRNKNTINFWKGKMREKSHNWKGGSQEKYGYNFIYQGQTQGLNGIRGNYRAEHCLIMEKKLGRLLKKGEIIHHINYNRKDNRIENLYLTNWKQHNNYEANVKSTYFKWILAENMSF